MPESDRVIRAVTFDGAFRVIAVRTTELVRDALRIQPIAGQDTRLFGELLTGAILVRETMSPGQRVQMVLKRDGVGQVVVDSHPIGPELTDNRGAMTRGLVHRHPEGQGQAFLSEDTILKVIRSLPRGQLHQSIVEANVDGTSRALMHYMQTSEQIVAMLGVTAVMDGDHCVAAGGYIVQLLPECTDAPLAIMTERLAHDFADLDRFVVEHDAAAAKLKDELLYGFDHEVLADTAVHYGCDCSEERVLGAVATLGRDELMDIVARGEVVALTCEYCQTHWALGTDRLRSLLVSN
jgi:molecular chaperone Hsp33